MLNKQYDDLLKPKLKIQSQIELIEEKCVSWPNLKTQYLLPELMELKEKLKVEKRLFSQTIFKFYNSNESITYELDLHRH